MKKVGIMGGTFNPIHNGHLTLAAIAKKTAQLDEVWFMPSGLPAHKSNSELLSAKVRLHLVELAIAGNSGFQASSFEIDRDGFTYTADTMVALTIAYPDTEFFFIIGGDSLMKFHHWVRPDVISAHTTLLAAGRNGYSKEQLLQQAEQLKQLFETKIKFLDMPELNISSNAIRTACRQKQYTAIQNMVPKSVLHYIREQSLWTLPMN